MESNEKGVKYPTANHIVTVENYNYFEIGMELVDASGDNDNQMRGDDDTGETCDVFVVQEGAQKTKENDAIVDLNEKTSSEASDYEDEINVKVVSSDDEEPLTNTYKKRSKEDGPDMVWEDLRPMFPCSQCSYGTKKRYLLLRHLKTHDKDRNHKFKKHNENADAAASDDEKHKNFNEEIPLATLTKNDTKDDDDIDDNALNLPRNFTCDECSYNTDKRYLLSRHVKIHSGCRPHKCSVCERGFTTVGSLQAHVNMHYGIKNKICKYCEKSFTTSGELNRHVKYKHTQEKPHKCTECDYAAVERSKLQRHMRYHSGERPYQCQHCTYASQDTYQLRRHLRSHTGEKPYKCDNCNSSYAHSTSLKLHKYTHNSSDNKLYACELCPAKNARKSELREHVKRMHYSDKVLKCKRCEETFYDQYSFRLHNKTHEREKCFKCQLCSFAAKKFNHLKSHMMIHTGERPIDCAQSFVPNSILNHGYQCHNKTYVQKVKPYECQKCKRTFAYKAFLARHEAVHYEHTNTQE